MPHEKSAGKRGLNRAISLDTVAPYDFFLSHRIFPPPDPPAPENNSYRYLLRLDGRPALALVTEAGTVEEPLLWLRIRAEGTLSAAQIEDAKVALTSILNLSLDLLSFYQYVRKDPILSPITERLRGLKPRKTATVFEILVRSIIEQQISLYAAHHIQERLIQSFGEIFSLEDSIFSMFPTPEQLARATEEDLRACGLSRNKASYILGIANAVAAGSWDLKALAGEPDTDVLLASLKEIRGVGQWTAEMVMLRGMGRYEAFPADDLGLRKTLSRFYCRESPLTAEKAREIAEPWGPWKGLAGFYLVAAEWAGVEIRPCEL
jgi:DNA-3-methyladenine glycosylase II